ncbi:unnamed protein product [Symbiodinium sp. CCMP2592]|nr:unnamed protein product [Symbiodinium sp. CCMP2592]
MLNISGKIEADRKEALPLPMFVLGLLERSLLLAEGSVQHRLFIGAVLVCCWSSLRLSDAQHTKWTSLQSGSWCLRGVNFRTKVSRRGVPFGLITQGIYGFKREFTRTWVAKYLSLLGEEWDAVVSRFGDVTPDCLFFRSTDSEFAPMSYGEVLSALRCTLISLGLSAEEARDFTVHSMKACLLAVMAQRGFRTSRREAQGHHQPSGRSARLYSRDDIWPALEAQRALVQSLRSGWMPSTPLGRGGQHPTPQRPFVHVNVPSEPSSVHPRFPLLDVSPPEVSHEAVQVDRDESQAAGISDMQAPTLEASLSSSSESEQDAGTSGSVRRSSVAISATFQPEECDEFLFLQGASGTVHVAAPQEGASGTAASADGHTAHLRPRCGALAKSFAVLSTVPVGARLCMHVACRRVLVL